MKSSIKLMIMLTAMAVFSVSCNKDKEEDKDVTPVITNLKAENHDGGTTIPRGGTISVDFDARSRSDARLDFYHIEIHDHPVSGLAEDEYKIIDDSFKNKSTFKGLRNAHVHEHIIVPDTANLGKYHVVVTVVDEAGYSTDTEEWDIEIEIVEAK